MEGQGVAGWRKYIRLQCKIALWAIRLRSTSLASIDNLMLYPYMLSAMAAKDVMFYGIRGRISFRKVSSDLHIPLTSVDTEMQSSLSSPSIVFGFSKEAETRKVLLLFPL